MLPASSHQYSSCPPPPTSSLMKLCRYGFPLSRADRVPLFFLIVACARRHQAATTLIHRGFDNVFVLSKGIVGFARDFKPFVEGDINALPLDVGQEKTATSTKSLHRSGHRRLGGGGGSSNNGSASARDNSTNGSIASSVYSKRNGAYGTTSSNSGNTNGMGKMPRRTSSSSTRSNNTGCHNSSSSGQGGGRASIRVTGGPSARFNGGGGGNDGMHNSTPANSNTGFSSNDGSPRQQHQNHHHQQQQQHQRGMLLSARAVAESNPPPSISNGDRISGGSNTVGSRAMQASTMHAPCFTCRLSPGRSSYQDSEAYSVGGEGNCGRQGGGSREGGNPDGSFSANSAAPSGRGLVEAATAASAAHRRRLGGGAGRDVSRGSAVSVAESVISRATARRGRW